MSRVELTLPDSLKEFLDREANAKGYPSPSEYVTALLQDLQKRRAVWAKLEPLVLEGLASPLGEVTEEDWNELYSEIDRIEAGQDQS